MKEQEDALCDTATSSASPRPLLVAFQSEQLALVLPRFQMRRRLQMLPGGAADAQLSTIRAGPLSNGTLCSDGDKLTKRPRKMKAPGSAPGGPSLSSWAWQRQTSKEAISLECDRKPRS